MRQLLHHHDEEEVSRKDGERTMTTKHNVEIGEVFILTDK